MYHALCLPGESANALDIFEAAEIAVLKSAIQMYHRKSYIDTVDIH